MIYYKILYNNSDHTVTIPWAIASQVLEVLSKGEQWSKPLKDGDKEYFIEMHHILALVPSTESDNKSIRSKIEESLKDLSKQIDQLKGDMNYHNDNMGLAQESSVCKSLKWHMESWLRESTDP